MVTAGKRKPARPVGRLARLGVIATALGAQAGCTREFFREWANQDVTEAVFEKSRDPRWRLDTFSIEPPALSRFADPYDQDFPPAPPDDPATEALSPVPQWPDNRLIVPVGGDGLSRHAGEMEERAGRRGGDVQQRRLDPSAGPVRADRDPLEPGPASPPGPPQGGSPFAPGGGPAVNGPGDRHDPATPRRRCPGPGRRRGPPVRTGPPRLRAAVRAPERPAAYIPPGGLSGRRSAGNSGPDSEHSTPILLADARSGKTSSRIPPPRPASSFTANPSSRPEGLKDGDVRTNGPPGRPAPGSRAGGSARPGTPPLPDARRT